MANSSFQKDKWSVMAKDFSTCTMGVGCAEAGKCYAMVQGKPDMCQSSNPPRTYDLTDPAEQQRLFRELRGYMSTCLKQHHGTDAEGRLFAANALKEILRLGVRLQF
jgi:hypothetical protein